MDLHIDMYKDNMVFPFIISFVFFFMYMILQFIELNTYIKSLDVLNPAKTTRSTIIYSYFIGYYVFFFKLVLQLLTIVVIVTMTVWIMVVLINLIYPVQLGGYASAAALKGGSSSDLGTALEKSAKGVVSYIMGVFFAKNFLMIFFIMIPIFLLFFTIGFSQFYDREIINKKNNKQSSRITTTNHNFMMFMMATLVGFGASYIGITYIDEMWFTKEPK